MRARWAAYGLAALLLLAASPGAAQEFAIVGGTVLPVSGPPIAGATVFVRDGRIVAVGTDVQVPSSPRSRILTS